MSDPTQQQPPPDHAGEPGGNPEAPGQQPPPESPPVMDTWIRIDPGISYSHVPFHGAGAKYRRVTPTKTRRSHSRRIT